MTFDVAHLTSELDTHLAGADDALAAGFPGERADRQPVHTVYVPADRYDVGLVPRWGAEALAALDAHGGDAAAYAAGAGPAGRPRRRGGDPGAGQARRRADRGPADRLRGRLRQPLRRRGGRGGRRRGRRTAPVDRRRECGTVPRHQVQELRGAHARSRSAVPGQVRRGGRRRRPPARRVRRDAAQGHLGRPGRGDGAGLRTARSRARTPPRRDRLRDPGRDTAVDPRSRRDSPRRPHGARVGGAVHRTALRDLRLLGLVRHRGAVPVDGAPGRRPREGRHAGGCRRHRCAALGRVHQRPARG